METEPRRNDRTRDRRTRYTVGNPPPNEKAIRRVLKKEIARDALPKSRAQALIAGELRKSEKGADTGPADEVLRYLLNERFVRLDGNKVRLVNPPKKRQREPERVIVPGPRINAPQPPSVQPTNNPPKDITMSTKSSLLSFPSRKFRSGYIEFFEFTISASEFAKYGEVSPHATTENGVQRGFRLPHARKIMQAMLEGKPFPENVLVNLKGEWIADEQLLIGNPGNAGRPVILDVLDGQHRLKALHMLLQDGRKDIVEQYEFKIVAVIDANKDQCRELFRLQTQRMAVDTSHLLELASEDGKFATNGTQNAYELAKMLAEDERSPLKGLIVFGEKKGVGGQTRVKQGEFHISSFLIYLRVIGGSEKSQVRRFTIKRRGEILIDLFVAARAVYGQFLNPDHPLGRPAGLCALMALLASPGHFHLIATRLSGGEEDPYTLDVITKVLTLNSRFMWKLRANSPDAMRMQPYSIAKRFNAYLERNAP